MGQLSEPILTDEQPILHFRALGNNSRFDFLVYPHMLRHATGYKLANDGQDTRAIQHYLGHKNIQHTVRYPELNSTRFNRFWND
jgi:site-specific recombinase XerD